MKSVANIRLVTLYAVVIGIAFATPSQSGSLRDAAQHSQILIGAAARPINLSERAYAETLAREFNMLEPEDSLKWEVLRPDPQSFDFRQADQLVDFAIRHNMKVRGHTLVWHRQNPAWLIAKGYTPIQLSQFLEGHIKTVVAHYKGKIFAWDVANEALDEGARTGQLRSTIWYDQPGIGYAGQSAAYLAQCFRWAHEADPHALLFYNEAEADEVNKKSDALYDMVREFKRKGVPIDGVGLQMHIGNLAPNIGSISANIERFTALGLQVHITEMDVSLPIDANGNASAASLQKQADIYRRVAEVCLAHPGCT
ncbi:MAG: endo-1,4-beta-xylanase, partial [Terriglobales bacterium]